MTKAEARNFAARRYGLTRAAKYAIGNWTVKGVKIGMTTAAIETKQEIRVMTGIVTETRIVNVSASVSASVSVNVIVLVRGIVRESQSVMLRGIVRETVSATGSGTESASIGAVIGNVERIIKIGKESRIIMKDIETRIITAVTGI